MQMPRPYRLGRRQELVDRTAHSILSAAQDLVSQKPAEAVSVGAVARRAGVSRLTVYQRFGSRSGLLEALAPRSAMAEAVEGDPRDALRHHLVQACTAWAVAPALYRHLPARSDSDSGTHRPRSSPMNSVTEHPNCPCSNGS